MNPRCKYVAGIFFGLLQLLRASTYAQELVSTLAGSAAVPGHQDGRGMIAQFHDPAGLAVDTQGNIFVADSQNHVIRRLSEDGAVITFAGQPGVPGSNDGLLLTARFDTPSALACSIDGSLFVADTGNHTVRK